MRRTARTYPRARSASSALHRSAGSRHGRGRPTPTQSRRTQRGEEEKRLDISLISSEADNEAARSDDVVDPWARRRNREVARYRVYVPQLTTEAQPLEAAYVDASSELKRASVRVA